MGSLEEYIKQMKDLQNKYPAKLKFLKSESDVDSINMDVMMEGVHETFENSDANMPKFVADHLASGKEVAILPVGKHKVMILAGQRLLKRGY